jgi:hypothetical protein
VVDNADYSIINFNYGTILPLPVTQPNTLTASSAFAPRSIRLQWLPPANETISGFRIWRSSDGVNYQLLPDVIPANQWTWNDNSMGDGAKRTYRVRAFKTLGNGAIEYSSATNKAWAVTNLPGPGELSATPAANGVNLNFTDNTNGETGFEVWQSTSGGAYVLVDTLPANAEQGPMVYRVNGLAPVTSYSFRVRAKSAAQSSIFTLRETVTTMGAVISITNSSFEAAVPDPANDPVPGWEVIETAASDRLVVRAPTQAEFPDGAAQGTKALRITRDFASDGTVGIEQTVAASAAPNTRYTVKLKAGAGLTDAGSLLGQPQNPPPPQVSLEIEGQVGSGFVSVINPLVYATFAADGEFQEYSLQFDTGTSVSSGALKLVISGFDAGDYSFNPFTAWVDEVSMTATPLADFQSPRGGTPWPVPGVIEFEDFDDGGQNVSWLDTTDGNTGGEYRRDTDADVDVARDDTGSFIVGWAKPTEWLEYTIDVINAGNYDLTSYVRHPARAWIMGHFIGSWTAAPSARWPCRRPAATSLTSRSPCQTFRFRKASTCCDSSSIPPAATPPAGTASPTSTTSR